MAAEEKLPSDLQFRIARRLPSRHLCRARSVCKAWNKELSSGKNKKTMFAWLDKLVTVEGEILDVPVDEQDKYAIASTGGLLLVGSFMTLMQHPELPFIVTNPLTKCRHLTSPKPFPPGLHCTRRLHASVHDGIESAPSPFTVVMVSAPHESDLPVDVLFVYVYRPETGWDSGRVISLGESQLFVLSRSHPIWPIVYSNSSLYFLTVPKSDHSFGDAGEYTLNRVQLFGQQECVAAEPEKVLSWSSLPMGMWPAKGRVHPKLVSCGGQILLVGTSFNDGEQGPIVLLELEGKSSDKSWRVMDELNIPGYVAKAGVRPIQTGYCDGSKCFYFECFCYEDFIVTAWPDGRILLFFPHPGGDIRDQSLSFSYDVSSRSWFQFQVPICEPPVLRRKLVPLIC